MCGATYTRLYVVVALNTVILYFFDNIIPGKGISEVIMCVETTV